MTGGARTIRIAGTGSTRGVGTARSDGLLLDGDGRHDGQLAAVSRRRR